MVKNDFYWGASTSAFQVEGGFGEGGKGVATTDVRKVPEGIADSKIASWQHFSRVHHGQMLNLAALWAVFEAFQ